MADFKGGASETEGGLKHLIVPENKIVLKIHENGGMLKGHRNQSERPPDVQN